MCRRHGLTGVIDHATERRRQTTDRQPASTRGPRAERDERPDEVHGALTLSSVETLRDA